MESGTNLNKGDGLAGKSKADDLRAFMHKSTTETRQAIGELKNPNSSFEGLKVSDGSFSVVDHASDLSFVGRTSQTGVMDTNTIINPYMDSFLERDHVRVSTFLKDHLQVRVTLIRMLRAALLVLGSRQTLGF
uniref:Uncharacterized protein n=1 Tax=Tanacetum cinerariifolium TaxID=118510 RepID=A0A699LES6_TANCI|nr:hypothetical protein [Tanacetum cinerariifolium]